MASFDAVAAKYEAGRPPYPETVFDALEPLAGMRVLEGGAGTGIATAALLRRGALVIPFDVGIGVLIRARARIPGLPIVVADGAAMPFRDRCAHLLAFAQSWHWLDEDRRATEAARVLRERGRWAAWWSHARADGEPWFEAYWTAIEAVTVARREQRDTDWGEGLERSELFDVGECMTLSWLREATVERWLEDERSKSYIAALPEPDRASLLATIERITRQRFPTGQMRVPYETYLWIARKK
jgi:SAM-dependent methyltransferase